MSYHLYTCSNHPTDNPQFQQEFLSKIAQIDFLVNTCQQLTNTIAIMRKEIGKG